MAGATLRNDSAEVFHDAAPLETAGNSVSLRCLNEAITASGIPDKDLAGKLGVSRGEFSKLRAGRFRLEQIDLLPESIRADYRERVQAADCVDPEAAAIEQIAVAAVRFLALKGRKRMVKAGL